MRKLAPLALLIRLIMGEAGEGDLLPMPWHLAWRNVPEIAKCAHSTQNCCTAAEWKCQMRSGRLVAGHPTAAFFGHKIGGDG